MLIVMLRMSAAVNFEGTALGFSEGFYSQIQVYEMVLDVLKVPHNGMRFLMI